jgi:uncharacterized protein (TIGR03086 family)
MLSVAISYAYAYHMPMRTDSQDFRPFDRVAVLASIELVDTVRLEDLHRPTPCAGWKLIDLLAHMTVQHRGFAAAARGYGNELDVWRPETVLAAVIADPAGTYRTAAHDVVESFADDAAPDATFALPEFGPGATFPGAIAMGFHFIDYVVHGWDVAETLAMPYDLPEGVVAAALPLALAIPDGDFRASAGAPFGPAVDTSGGTDLERIMRHLGRRPDWAVSENTKIA